MAEYTTIKNAIKDYYNTIESVDYIEDIEVYLVDSTYHISLVQGNYMRPLHIFIEAESENDLITKLIADLALRQLSLVKYGSLRKIK